MCCKPFRSRLVALASLAALIGLPRSADAAVIEGDRVTFNWQAASGPVAGYDVFVVRDGTVPSSPEFVVASPAATVTAAVDETISIQVSAFDAAGNSGPVSPLSESVLFTAPAPPPAPPSVVVEAVGDLSMEAARAASTAGEQVIVHMLGLGKQLLDTSIAAADGEAEAFWGLDQLIVGTPNEPTMVRLVDVLGLEQMLSPLNEPSTVTLSGLGNGAPCDRDGESGLIIHPGSLLVLGGLDLQVFDGTGCVLVNDLFAAAGDPNLIPWGDGQIAWHGDLEDDGVLDPDDNCLIVSNADQCDGDLDGFGNACDYDVGGDGIVDAADFEAVLQQAALASTDPIYDMNCDGAAGLDDISLMFSRLQQQVGPSGLACAADASCAAP